MAPLCQADAGTGQFLLIYDPLLTLSESIRYPGSVSIKVSLNLRSAAFWLYFLQIPLPST